MNVLNYAVFDSVSESWLQDDEKSWGGWNGAAAFTEAQLAQDIGDRENEDGKRTLYVMAVLGTL